MKCVAYSGGFSHQNFIELEIEEEPFAVMGLDPNFGLSMFCSCTVTMRYRIHSVNYLRCVALGNLQEVL